MLPIYQNYYRKHKIVRGVSTTISTHTQFLTGGRNSNSLELQKHVRSEFKIKISFELKYIFGMSYTTTAKTVLQLK